VRAANHPNQEIGEREREKERDEVNKRKNYLVYEEQESAGTIERHRLLAKGPTVLLLQ